MMKKRVSLGLFLALSGCGELDENKSAMITTSTVTKETGPAVCIALATSTLTVKVTDTAGNLIQGATVIFEANGGNEHLKANADTYIGVSNEKQLEPGTYTLTTTKAGYKSDVRSIVGKADTCWTKFESETVVLKAE